MSTAITFNGVGYIVPAYNDTGWAQGAGNLSSYLVAVATGCLQQTGGAFTLTADANFGASFGLASAYFKTRATSAAAAGLLRLANADTINWRNVANNADLALSIDNLNRLFFNGTIVSDGVLPAVNQVGTGLTKSGSTVSLTTPVTIANGGTNSTAGLNNNRIMISSAGAIIENAALAASSNVRSDSNGFLTTGAIALATADISGILPIGNGGTNSNTALTNGAVMISSGGKILESTILLAATNGLSFSSGKGIVGTTTNDNPTAGNVGEILTSSGNGTFTNFPTTVTYGDLQTITLTAGDWLVVATGTAHLNGATLASWIIGVSTTAGNNGAGLTQGNTRADGVPPTTTYDVTQTLVGMRFSVAGSTPIYLKMLANYSAGTPQITGTLTAIRIR